ncbi:hypothetical protein PSAC2689_30518 [Paraburkholderia sacchari]
MCDVYWLSRRGLRQGSGIVSSECIVCVDSSRRYIKRKIRIRLHPVGASSIGEVQRFRLAAPGYNRPSGANEGQSGPIRANQGQPAQAARDGFPPQGQRPAFFDPVINASETATCCVVVHVACRYAASARASAGRCGGDIGCARGRARSPCGERARHGAGQAWREQAVRRSRAGRRYAGRRHAGRRHAGRRHAGRRYARARCARARKRRARR